jgi:tetrahydromethanopterin S-methyltransferase subunit B
MTTTRKVKGSYKTRVAKIEELLSKIDGLVQDLDKAMNEPFPIYGSYCENFGTDIEGLAEWLQDIANEALDQGPQF